jgi:hypothetical protein
MVRGLKRAKTSNIYIATFDRLGGDVAKAMTVRVG